MAILKNALQFTGGISGLSAYTMKGSDKIILRTKGGPTKAQIKKSPNHSNTRLYISEFGGASKAASWIRYAITPVKHLNDYRYGAALTALCKHLQRLDKVSVLGERGIAVSQHRYLLEGFHLNKQHTLDHVIRHPLTYAIQRDTGAATIHIPQLQPGINLHIPWQQTHYRFIISLGVVRDCTYRADHAYNSPDSFPALSTAHLHSSWHSAEQPLEAQSFTLQLNRPEPLQDNMSVVLAFGIEMGPVLYPNKRRKDIPGCAKIIAVG
ncbi:hypothetical protein [Chitinophaga defluvii]|uniref:Uncharacterized protein n=1 Tax=Chitinophaga defluvii TaxID=3163343 RepID=A0ABV2T088_9BACT